MPRPKHPVPLPLKSLRFNPALSCYEITEAGITYSMQLEETRSLKAYFHAFLYSKPTIAAWHKTLSKEERNRITVAGEIKKDEDEFFPDMEYE